MSFTAGIVERYIDWKALSWGSDMLSTQPAPLGCGGIGGAGLYRWYQTADSRSRGPKRCALLQLGMIDSDLRCAGYRAQQISVCAHQKLVHVLVVHGYHGSGPDLAGLCVLV